MLVAFKERTTKKRLKQLEKDPETAWQVTERDRAHLKMYDTFVSVAEKVLTETSTAKNPWLIVEGSDIRYSSLTVGQHILNKINSHIKALQVKNNRPTPVYSPPIIHLSTIPHHLFSLTVLVEACFVQAPFLLLHFFVLSFYIWIVNRFNRISVGTMYKLCLVFFISPLAVI